MRETRGRAGHQVSLAVAARLGERERLRTYTLGNLQWLCRACHRAKTARDMETFRDPERRQPGKPVQMGLALQ